MSEFHDPDLRQQLGRLSGPYPDDNAAFAAWQRRVGQARRRRAMAWTIWRGTVADRRNGRRRRGAEPGAAHGRSWQVVGDQRRVHRQRRLDGARDNRSVDHRVDRARHHCTHHLGPRHDAEQCGRRHVDAGSRGRRRTGSQSGGTIEGTVVRRPRPDPAAPAATQTLRLPPAATSPCTTTARN